MAETAQERRRFSRIPAQAPLACQVREQGHDGISPPLPGKMRNVSTGGALLEMGKRLPPGATLLMGVLTKTGAIEVEGEVIWVTAGPSVGEGEVHLHGVQFVQEEGESDPTIQDLLSHYAMSTLMEGEPPADD